ncbi:Pycsar system effector family protein [Paraburkholderia heleia]|uniref:Pycsar system effector family protein n=1 Tax=Paraburkholderia heleia TaxID=634127 RepID=UPI0031D21336
MAEDGQPASIRLSEEERLKAARDQLNLVLSFFPRVDTKLSVVLGANVGMLGVLFSRLTVPGAAVFPPCVLWSLIGAFLVLMGFSSYHLYRGSFPTLEGGAGSLVYFSEIAARGEHDFVIAFSKLSLPSLTDDLLSQCWRNSVILKQKFASLRRAYVWSAVAVMPWAFALAGYTKF